MGKEALCNSGFRVGRLQESLQRHSILDRKCLSIVIEIDIAGFDALSQPGDSFCPLSKLFVRVWARIQTLAAVESDIGKITGGDQGRAKARHIKNTEPNIMSS